MSVKTLLVCAGCTYNYLGNPCSLAADGRGYCLHCLNFGYGADEPAAQVVAAVPAKRSRGWESLPPAAVAAVTDAMPELDWTGFEAMSVESERVAAEPAGEPAVDLAAQPAAAPTTAFANMMAASKVESERARASKVAAGEQERKRKRIDFPLGFKDWNKGDLAKENTLVWFAHKLGISYQGSKVVVKERISEFILANHKANGTNALDAPAAQSVAAPLARERSLRPLGPLQSAAAVAAGATPASTPATPAVAATAPKVADTQACKRKKTKATASQQITQMGDKLTGSTMYVWNTSRLSCRACCTIFGGGAQNDVMLKHLLTKTHQGNMLLYDIRKAARPAVQESLRQLGHGFNLPIEVLECRFDLLKARLKAGTPTLQMDILQGAIQRHTRIPLTAGGNLLRQGYMKLLRTAEYDLNMAEVGGTYGDLNPVASISDGTGLNDTEHMCMLLRAVRDYGASAPPSVVQRLIDLAMTTGSHNGRQLAHMQHGNFQKHHSDPYFNSVDSCAVNLVANDELNTVGGGRYDIEAVPCIPHSGANGGGVPFK